MRHFLSYGSLGLLAVGLAAMPLIEPLKAQEEKPAEANQTAPAEKPAQQDAQEEKAEAKRYWVGLQLMPVPEILRKHVEALQNGAATVAGIGADSPAAKSGFQLGDHILKAGDERITSPDQLVELLRDNQGDKVRMEVLRGTEKQTLEVTPAEPPKDGRWTPLGRLGQAPDAARFRFFGPGQMMPPGTRLQMMAEDLPQNVTIRVEQKGDEPARIHIERDGQTWDVTENEIDELPEDLQKLAKQYVNQTENGNTIIGGSEVPFSQMLRMFGGDGKGMPLPRGDELPDFQEMREQMHRDMQEVREMMRELRQRMEQQQQPANQPKLEGNEV